MLVGVRQGWLISMTYREELQKLVIDRILLGSIVGLAIYFGTVQIEKIKTNEGFKSELNRARIEKLADVWEKAADFEADFYKLYHAVESEKFAMHLDGLEISEESIYQRDKVKPYMDMISDSRTKLFSAVRRNSFYLGPTLEGQVLEFTRSLAFVDLYQKISLDQSLSKLSKPDSLDEAKNRVEHFRANIAQVRDYIIEGGR